MSRKNKFFYATGTICKNFFTNSICKVDKEKKETTLWRDTDFYYPGEVIFIPNPNGKDEDDGILISACSNIENGSDESSSKDFLLFVDAKTMKELGRAKFKAHIPQVNVDFYNNYFPY